MDWSGWFTRLSYLVEYRRQINKCRYEELLLTSKSVSPIMQDEEENHCGLDGQEKPLTPGTAVKRYAKQEETVKPGQKI